MLKQWLKRIQKKNQNNKKKFKCNWKKKSTYKSVGAQQLPPTKKRSRKLRCKSPLHMKMKSIRIMSPPSKGAWLALIALMKRCLEELFIIFLRLITKVSGLSKLQTTSRWVKTRKGMFLCFMLTINNQLLAASNRTIIYLHLRRTQVSTLKWNLYKNQINLHLYSRRKLFRR